MVNNAPVAVDRIGALVMGRDFTLTYFMWVVVVVMASIMSAAEAFELGGKTPQQAFPGIHGQLVQAAVDGDVGKMELLVRKGADPNFKGLQSMTPLMWAVAAHSHSGIRKLLELGGNPNEPTPRGFTITWSVAGGNDIESLRIVLDHGGDVNGPVFDCLTALMNAVFARQMERIELLMAHGADVNGQACGRGAPDIAAVIGRFDMVVYFLERGYNINLERLARNLSIEGLSPNRNRDLARALELVRQRSTRSTGSGAPGDRQGVGGERPLRSTGSQ